MCRKNNRQGEKLTDIARMIPAVPIILRICRTNFDPSRFLSGDWGPHSFSSDVNAGRKACGGLRAFHRAGIWARAVWRGDMIAQAAAVMRRPWALYPASLVRVRPAASFRWRAIVPGAVAHRNALAAGIFVLAAATLAIVNYQTAEQDTDAIEDGRNQTIVFRQGGGAYRQLEAMEAVADEQEEDDAGVVPWNFPRAVRTLRFFNRGSSQGVGSKRERLSTSRPYTVRGRTYVPTDNPAYAAEGVASWYGPDFHGHLTANGEHYDMNGFSAAHRTMPLPSYARVTNLDNGRSIIVRVNNRGPFVHNRIADLSVGTAKALDFYKKGTAHVRVEYVGPAPVGGSDDQMLLATLRAGAPAPAPANLMIASARGGDGKGPEPSER
jgi:rare lipoprotein A (peptidoglycan hydrolase)